jgi:insertion element IS1 protein InsB
MIWIWVAFERETKRIVGLAFGDRSSETCQELWQSLPADYRKRALCYTDFWQAYQTVLPSKRHHAVGKETGETAHVERFNNTLRQRAGPIRVPFCPRQRCSNLVRKTLSFSKRVDRHVMRVRGFVDVYNAPLEARVRISQL